MDLREVFKKEKCIKPECKMPRYRVRYIWWLEQKVFDLEKRLNQEVEPKHALNCYHHTRCDNAGLDGCDKKCPKYESEGC